MFTTIVMFGQPECKRKRPLRFFDNQIFKNESVRDSILFLFFLLVVAVDGWSNLLLELHVVLICYFVLLIWFQKFSGSAMLSKFYYELYAIAC